MSTAQLIYQEIEKIPNGEPFTAEQFKHLGNWQNVRKVLSRLTKNGRLARIEKGIYGKYKTYHGIKFIRTNEPLVKCIEKVSHETVVKFGTLAINQLGLSTQCQAIEGYYWTGRKKVITVGKRKISFRHINKKYANKTHPILEIVLSSAYMLGKEQFTVESLKLAEIKFGKEVLLEMKMFLHLMPTWLKTIFNKYYGEAA